MHLIPRPSSITEKNGEFIIERDTEIILSGNVSFDDLKTALILQEGIEKTLGFKLNINKVLLGKEYKNSIILKYGDFENKEEYKLNVTEDNIVIEGKREGIFYGTKTLEGLVREYGAIIKAVEIEDKPFFQFRGFYHDITRGKVQTLDTLKKLVDKASFYKLNQLQLYIEHTFAFKGMSELWLDKDPLTAEEILILDKYCKDRCVELVPSLSTFGHLYEALRTKSFRELCELEEVDFEYSLIDRMAHHTLNVTDERSIKFVEDMLEQYIPLFTSDKFNICCDETFDLGKGKSRQEAEKVGVGRLYADFLNKIYKIVKKHNKKVMFWGDIIVGYPDLLKDIPEDLICLTWNYSSEASGYSVKMTSEYDKLQYVCPGVSGWNMMMNLIEGSFSNISRMVDHGKKYGAIGVLNTNWGDFGNINLLANSIPSMIYGASISWNPNKGDFEELFKSISFMEFGDESMSLVGIMDKLSKNQVAGWGELIWWKEKLEDDGFRRNFEKIDVNKLIRGYEVSIECRKDFLRLLNKVSDKESLQSFIVSAKGWEIINKVLLVVSKIDFNKEIPMEIDNFKLAEEFELWFYDYSNLWRKKNKESELRRIREVVVYACNFLRNNK